MASFYEYREKLESKYNPSAQVDQGYINSFMSDAKKFLDSAESDYNKMGSGNSTDIANSRLKTATDLQKRSSAISQYLDRNKDYIDEETFNGFKSYLDEFDKASGQLRYAFYEADRNYTKVSRIENASIEDIEKKLVSDEDYDILFELSRTYVPYDRETAIANGVDEFTYNDIENKRQYIGEKYGVDLYADIYNNVNIFNDLMARHDNGGGIAYTTQDGKNVTWQSLYDTKMLEEDFSTKYAEFSVRPDFEEYSKGTITVDETRSDYDILFELSRTNVPYSRETAIANGVDEYTYNRIEGYRQYISEKYGVDLYADIYNNVNIFNSLMAQADGEWSTSVEYDYTDAMVADFDYMDYMTEEERAVLLYIYRTEGRDAALEWHNTRRTIYQNRAEESNITKMTNFGKESSFWASVGSVALNMGAGVEYITDLFDYLATGESQVNTLANSANAIRSGVSEKTDWMIGNWDAFDFLYNTGMSMADSAASMLTFGPYGGVALGLSAAASATNDALNRGMSQGQAFWNGIIAGTFEGLFETVSIGQFSALKETASTTFKELAKNLAKTMIVNLTEEGATEIANILYDKTFNGVFSSYETMMRQFMDAGLSEEEAKRETEKALMSQLGEAMASGALMGFGFGVAGSGGSYIANNREIKQFGKELIRDGGVDPLLEFSRELAANASKRDAKRLEKLASKVEKKASAKNVGRLSYEVQNQFSKAIEADAKAQKGAETAKKGAVALEGGTSTQNAGTDIASTTTQKTDARRAAEYQLTEQKQIAEEFGVDTEYLKMQRKLEHSHIADSITPFGQTYHIQKKSNGKYVAYVDAEGSSGFNPVEFQAECESFDEAYLAIKEYFLEQDSDAISDILKDYEGIANHSTEWLVENDSEAAKYSLRNTEDVANAPLSQDQESVIDLSEDNRLSSVVAGIHGSERYKKIREYILVELANQPIRLSDGKFAIVDRSDAQHIARNAGDKKTTEISHIKQIIEEAQLVAEEESAKDRKFDYFWYYEAFVKYGGETIPVYVNVGRTRNDSSYHIYDLTQKIRDTAHRVNDVERPKPNEGYALENGISNSSIPQTGEKSNSFSKKSSKTGKVTLLSDGREATVEKIVSVKDGVATVRLSDGSTVQSIALDFGSDTKNELYDKIPRIEGMVPESADALIGAYSETSGITAQQYARAVELGYLYGAAGIRMDQISQATEFWDLSESQRRLAYELGAAVRAEKDAKREAEIERQKQAAREKTKKSAIVIEADSELAERIKSSSKSKYTVIRDYLVEKFGGKKFTLSDGLTAVMDKRDAQHLAHLADDVKTAELSNLKNVVEKAEFSHEASKVTHDKFNAFRYYAATVKVGTESYDILINVGRSKYDQKYHIYDITKNGRTAGQASPGLSRPVGNAMRNSSSTNSIPDSDGKVNSFSENNSERQEASEPDRRLAYELGAAARAGKDAKREAELREQRERSAKKAKEKADEKTAESSEKPKSAEKERITVGMSEGERADVLRNKRISPAPISKDADLDIGSEALETKDWEIAKKLKKPIVQKLRELGFLKNYRAEAIDVDFEFTGNGALKSANSQILDYGGSLGDFAKVVMNLQAILDRAVLLEIHTDKAVGTSKENSRLLQTYVLLGAFQEGNFCTPVQFEIKQYTDNKNRLYLAVALTKIETGVVSDTAPLGEGRTRLLPVSDYSIAELIKKVNTADENFFKYIPDEFLTPEQIEAKHRALAKEAKKYGKETPSQAVSKTEKTMRKEGTVTVKADESTLSERQKVSVACLRSLAKAIGVNFVVEKLSTRTRMGRVGENGRFDRKTNTVYLDLNAGNDGEGVILYTASHELTHFIAKWSPKKYKILREMLFDFYGKTNKDVIAMAREQMSAAKEAGHPITFEAAIEEVVADAMERMLTDGNAQMFFESLEKKDKSIVEKIKAYFRDLLAKIRKAYEGAAFQSDEAQFLHESAEAVERVQALFFDALSDASETYREIGEGVKDSQTSVDSESFSVRKGQGDQEITSADVEALRSIGRKSINKFTSEDIQKAEKWARKFYIELGAKSPFFRAWFGDWRAHSQDPVTVTNIPKSRQGNQRQNVVCKDTGWTVRISGHGERNTRAHAGGEYLSVRGLNNIVELIKNAIFLDSEIHEHHDNNAPNEMISFDHKCYSLGRDNRGNIALYKITIEDIFQSKSEPNDLRFHNLRYVKEIKKVVEDISGSSDQSDQPYTANSDTSTTTYSISDLFDFVKRYDTEFSPKSVNPMMLNKDGSPKVLYHGTRAKFTQFELQDKAGLGRVLGDGFYFTSSYEKAHQFANGRFSKGQDRGGIVMPVYLYMENPYVIEKDVDRTKWMEEYNRGNYDGIIDLRHDTYYVENATQIKSAAEAGTPGANIGTFDVENPDILYSLRKSNRSTLTAALDSVVTDPDERKILEVYRKNIESLDAQQERLRELNAEIKQLSFSDGEKDRAQISELRQEAIKTQNRINLYDKKLLGLEAMAPMKRVVERQAQKAYERAAERGRETLTKRRESAERTELRNKIKRVVQDLNQYLLRGTKDRHVPIGLQNAVASALNAVNMDTVEADKRIERLEAELMMAKTPAEMQKISRKIDHIREMGDRLDQRLGALRAAYNGITESEDPMVRNAYDEVVAGLIQKTIDAVGETPLRSMTREQLELVYDSYKAVLKRVRDANKAFKLEGDQKISSLGDQVMEEILKVGGAKEYRAEIAETISRLGWNNLKPIYAFERIGSTVFTSLFNNVRAGEDTWARDVSEAREFYLKVNKKYHYASWDFEKRYRFKSKTGKSFSLTLEQMMSLYAYSKREQADKHLEVGGFVFSGDVVRYKEAVDEGGGNGKKQKKTLFKYKVNTSSAYSISKETLGSIAASLTEEQREFVDEMQEYLSTVMGEKGNEVSLALYDVKLYKERFYFPLKSAKQFMFEQNETAGEVKVKNSGFSNETKPQAGNPIILSGFMDVWANHVNDMSMYHAFVLPLEDFNRVFNWNSNVYEDDKSSVSVKSRMQDAYGEESVQYVSQLLKDLNGGARTDPRETTAKALMSKFKKASVMASLSVVVQQPTSIVRAMALVDPKYFVGQSVQKQKSHRAKWEQLKKYAPVAIIKEMGYFDTNMGRSTVDWIKDEKTFMDRVDDAMSKAPALADELTWVAIWEAVKREIASEHTDLSQNSEELLKLAGERFTEVVAKTQVYDSVLSRSSNMRAKSAFMNMLTSFMGEPTTSINMLEDALRQGKCGKKGYAARAIFSLFGSVMLNSALVSLVYAIRDDDEDETFLEKYFSHVATEILDGLNPLTYLPIFRDIWSIMQGFDVERADMSLVSDLADAFKKVVKTAAKDTENMDEDEFKAHMMTLGDDLLGVLSSLCSLTGIPLKNVVRESKALINIFEMIGRKDKTTFGSIVDQVQEDVQSSVPVLNWFQKESKSDRLYDAVVKGDDTYIDRLKKSYSDEEAYVSAVRKALRENDGRVTDAADAMLDGDFDAYENILNEIAEEGHFSVEDVAYAINSERNAKMKKLDPEASGRTLASVEVVQGDEKEKSYSIYAASDINVLLASGNNEKAKEVIGKLVAFKMEHGKTEKEAKASLRSSLTSYWKDLYTEAWNARNYDEATRIRKLLYATGLYGRLSELDDILKSWRKKP